MVKLGALTPIVLGIMVMVSDIIKKQTCTSGKVGSFRKVVSCRRLQFVPKWNKLLLTANMFHFGTSCDSSFKELSPNLVKTSEPDVEDMRKCLEISRLELAQI